MRDIDINYATHFINYKYNQQIHQFITYNFYYLYFDTLVESTFSNGTHTYKPSSDIPSMPLVLLPVPSAIAASISLFPCPSADWYTVNDIVPVSIALQPTLVASIPRIKILLFPA